MKKVLSIALVIMLLVSGLFILTGCGNEEKKIEGKTITYDYSGTSVSVVVPEESTYEWTKEKPTNSIGFSGTFYLVGEGESIVMPANVPHAVYGEENFKMLLVVTFPQ